MATKSWKGEKRQRKIPNRFKDSGLPSESQWGSGVVLLDLNKVGFGHKSLPLWI